jgi:acetyl esterase/lipase
VSVVASILFLALLVLALVALVPVHRPPFATFSFMIGFVAGELAGQLLAATVLLGGITAALGGFQGRFGVVALGLGTAAAAAFASLLVCGLLARTAVTRGLAGARGVTVAPATVRPSWLRWWRTVGAVPLHGPGVVVHRDLPYDEDGDPAHVLDVLTVRGGATAAPVMVFVHGGAWTIGSKAQQCLPMLFELASQGWVVVTCDYRLSPKSTWPDHVVDVKRFVAWTRDHVGEFGGDPDRFLAISGNSAGGHLAALTALTPGVAEWQPGFEHADTSVDACVSLYGVLDFTDDPDAAGLQGRALQSLLGRSVMKVGLLDAPDVYEAASPIHRITEDAPPFLVLHGTKDTLVSVGIARAFVARFKERTSAPIAYVELPWAQHGYDTLCSPRCSATVGGIARFLEALVPARVARPGPPQRQDR